MRLRCEGGENLVTPLMYIHYFNNKKKKPGKKGGNTVIQKVHKELVIAHHRTVYNSRDGKQPKQRFCLTISVLSDVESI